MQSAAMRLDNGAFRPTGPFGEREIGLLRDVVLALSEQGVETWLDQGTLLGTTRDGKLLPWDHDVDLGAWRDDITSCEPQLAAALHERLSGIANVSWGCRTIGITPVDEGAHLPVNIGLYERSGDQAVKWFGRPPRGMTPSRRVMQAVVAKTVKPVFLAPCSSLLRFAGKSAATRDRHLVGRVASVIARGLLDLRDRGRDTVAAPIKTSVDAEFFEHLRPAFLGDVRVFVPANAEDYLALKYGRDWRTPKRAWNYWTQDGAIVHG